MTVMKIVAALAVTVAATSVAAQMAKPDDKGQMPMQGMREGDKAGMSKHMNEMHKGDMRQHHDRMMGTGDKPRAAKSKSGDRTKSKQAAKSGKEDHSAHHPDEKK